MFHYTREAIEAHLTIVFAALAVAHAIQSRTGLSIGKVVKQLRPLRSATIYDQRRHPDLPARYPTGAARNPRPTSASNRGTRRNVRSQVLGDKAGTRMSIPCLA